MGGGGQSVGLSPPPVGVISGDSVRIELNCRTPSWCRKPRASDLGAELRDVSTGDGTVTQKRISQKPTWWRRLETGPAEQSPETRSLPPGPAALAE